MHDVDNNWEIVHDVDNSLVKFRNELFVSTMENDKFRNELLISWRK